MLCAMVKEYVLLSGSNRHELEDDTMICPTFRIKSSCFFGLGLTRDVLVRFFDSVKLDRRKKKSETFTNMIFKNFVQFQKKVLQKKILKSKSCQKKLVNLHNWVNLEKIFKFFPPQKETQKKFYLDVVRETNLGVANHKLGCSSGFIVLVDRLKKS